MARSTKRKSKHAHTKGNLAKRKKVNGVKPEKKYRDFRHVAQRKNLALTRREPTRENDVADDSVEEHVDPLQLLLSTFSNSQKLAKPKAVDSDSDEESDEDNEVPPADTAMSQNNTEDNDDDDDDDEEEESLSQEEKESEADNMKDPFLQHLTGNLDASLLKSVQANPKHVIVSKLNWPVLKDLKVEIPVRDQEINATSGLLDKQEFVKSGEVPQMITNSKWDTLYVKKQISQNLKEANKMQTSQLDSKDDLTPLQRELFSIMNNYQDLFYPKRTFKNAEEVRFTYCLHVVNHILKTRLKVIHHNDRLREKEREEIPDEFRDQGLVRPRVLILAPFRESCFRIVNTMTSILFSDKKPNVVNRTRFQEEFTGSELFMPKKNRKPEDFEQLFAGNVDDSFRIGLSFTRKSLKLYSDFYSSDVIIASPLGVRMLIGAEGEKDRDFDFLASIEVLVLDQADVFLMQNWDHVIHIMNHLHMQPRESHGTDFSRVRLWALQGWARFYRQTIICSSIMTPELNALFNRHCANYAGAVRVRNSCDVGSISQVLIPMPHVYRRYNCSSVLEATEERFRFLVEDILPQFSDLSGVLLYIPSYFDFVRLRNHLKANDFSFTQICEYSKDAKVARARDMFFHSEVRLLLYSERYHFYRRVNIKGIRHLIFYQPPTYPHFYSEMCNMMQETNQNGVADGSQSVTVLFSKYDVHSLTGIIREARAARVISSDKSVFMFTTGWPQQVVMNQILITNYSYAIKFYHSN